MKLVGWIEFKIKTGGAKALPKEIRRKAMLTEKQKREFENLFNFYSLQREYDSELITEWSAKMWAFRTAVSILGYEFEYDHMEENNGVSYFSYKLVEIGK